MDETKNPSIDEVLDQPKLRRVDEQTAGFRAAAAAADEMNTREGFRVREGVGVDMRTGDDKRNESAAEAALKELRRLAGIGGDPKHVKDVLKSVNPGPRESAYPELSKGKLLFQTEEYDAPKEYITLQMKEDKTMIKKILDQRGCLTGHPEIPCDSIAWDMPNLDCIQKAIREEFPDGKLIEEKGGDIAKLISKYLGGTPVSFGCSNYKLTVKSVATKFKLKDIDAAVRSLSVILPAKEAERIVAKEIAKKIQNVL